MTVCAAAICTISRTLDSEEFAIVGISDRMFTSGDVEYEPRSQTKFWWMPPAKTVALASGSWPISHLVTGRTLFIIEQQGIDNVSDAAKLQSEQYAFYRKEFLERLILAPLGMDTNSFARRQKQLLPEIALEITHQLRNYDLQTESILCGFDKSGPHVYQVSETGYTCHDAAGFYASGSGSRQFETIFMSHGYDCSWSVPEALLLLYRAKKNAEASPGVGKLTDMFVMNKDNGFTGLFNDATLGALDGHYKRFAAESRKLANATADEIRKDNLIPTR
jgi:20S proteasome alpha/beta subunit